MSTVRADVGFLTGQVSALLEMTGDVITLKKRCSSGNARVAKYILGFMTLVIANSLLPQGLHI